MHHPTGTVLFSFPFLPSLRTPRSGNRGRCGCRLRAEPQGWGPVNPGEVTEAPGQRAWHCPGSKLRLALTLCDADPVSFKGLVKSTIGRPSKASFPWLCSKRGDPTSPAQPAVCSGLVSITSTEKDEQKPRQRKSTSCQSLTIIKTPKMYSGANLY